MYKRKLVTPIVVGMAMLLMGVPTLGILASDGASSAGDATTPPAASATQPSTSANEQITTLKQQMALQQKQIEQMQKALEDQKRLLEQLSKPASTMEQAAQSAKPAAGTGQAAQPAKAAVGTEPAAQPHPASLGEVASTTPMIPQSQAKVENAAIPAPAGQKSVMDTETSPLQIHLGSATITPVAFMDFTSVYRNKVTNGSIATNFGSVPYDTTGASTLPYQANLSEFRLSTENSRIGLRVDADVKGAHVIGYMEADFHGNNAASVAVSTNSNTLRERVYWVDLNTGKFEILGGQTWTLLTPGRSGISPLPADIFYSQDVDVNYQLGLVFGRIPELRFVYHPTNQWAFAVALDSPDQYIGGNGGTSATLVTLPTALATTYAAQLDNSANTLATPNLAPDIIAKLAFDPNKHAHFEIGGIERTFKVYYPGVAATSTVAAIPAANNTSEGGGGFVNLNFEVVKGFRLLTNNFWSDGGGRYIYGLAPDLVVRSNGSLSLVHSGSTVSGFEANAKNTMIYGYYGGIDIGRNTGFDTNGTTPIGYGYSLRGTTLTSAQAATQQSQNRNFQELTFGFNQTLWKNAKYGALNFMGQYSYLTRSPFLVAAGTPTNANVNMVFFNLRYTLPGSAPTMGKPY
ncbi:MAG: hypothetical protein ABSG32_05910 [Terriglobia bacterium]